MRMTFAKALPAVIVLVACSRVGWPQTATAQTDPVVAIVDGRQIRASELEDYAQHADPLRLFQVNTQLYDFREQMLDDLIDQRLLSQEAARRKVSVDDLLARELKVEPVTEEEIQATFESVNAQQTDSGQQAVTLDIARPLIVKYLQGRKRSEARSRYVKSLREAAKKGERPVSWLLAPPRLGVDVSPTDPARGGGPIEVVEFGDFQCPYCQQLEPILQRIGSAFPGRIRLVWKDNPLPDHPRARTAAEAARCAGEQGRFWEYHDALFADPGLLASFDFHSEAEALKLDTHGFDQCVSSGRYRAEVDAGARQAAALGVTASPTLFINGRMLPGVASYDKYEGMIARELSLSDGH